jgi:hypothetical protein
LVLLDRLAGLAVELLAVLLTWLLLGEFCSGTVFLLVKALNPITSMPSPMTVVMISAVVIAEACFMMISLLNNLLLLI